ncbi:MAG TPA: hypothetical protein VF438_00060 [Candidatus Paceibacterota bacterium]
MNVQSRTQKIVLSVILIVVVIVVIIYVALRKPVQQNTAPAPLTPEQKQQVLDSLQPKNPPAGTSLTSEQKRALNSMGTSPETAQQSSNTPDQEKSVLNSLQSK